MQFHSYKQELDKNCKTTEIFNRFVLEFFSQLQVIIVLFLLVAVTLAQRFGPGFGPGRHGFGRRHGGYYGGMYFELIDELNFNYNLKCIFPYVLY